MTSPKTKDVWLREEYKDRPDEVESHQDFEERRGLRKGVLSSRFREYADRKPKVVKTFGRQEFFAATELDEFIDSIGGHLAARTPAEVLASEVARREEAIQKCEDRIAKHMEGVNKARRDKKAQEAALEDAKRRLHLEVHGR